VASEVASRGRRAEWAGNRASYPPSKSGERGQMAPLAFWKIGWAAIAR
jgi:hypothetical protein